MVTLCIGEMDETLRTDLIPTASKKPDFQTRTFSVSVPHSLVRPELKFTATALEGEDFLPVGTATVQLNENDMNVLEENSSIHFAELCGRCIRTMSRLSRQYVYSFLAYL